MSYLSNKVNGFRRWDVSVVASPFEQLLTQIPWAEVLCYKGKPFDLWHLCITKLTNHVTGSVQDASSTGFLAVYRLRYLNWFSIKLMLLSIFGNDVTNQFPNVCSRQLVDNFILSNIQRTFLRSHFYLRSAFHSIY